jgi:glycosyltransferase involved in cell wall biosynthesis
MTAAVAYGAPAGRFAVLIPVYNHVGGVVSVVERALALGLPVWVVDDGSTDGTAAALEQFSGIQVLRHEKNRGKGEAILTGLAAMNGKADWAVTLDADGQHDPADVPGLMRAIPVGGRPIVIGRREGMMGEDVPGRAASGGNFPISGSGRPEDLFFPTPRVAFASTLCRRPRGSACAPGDFNLRWKSWSGRVGQGSPSLRRRSTFPIRPA